MMFSILVPVYNVEAFLNDCILSVMDQTYQNFELILVDDGSKDNSGRICDDYSSGNPERIKVIHKANEGSMIARNTAINAANGDVIVFLDADDCLRRDALERLYDAFVQYQCDMVMYNYSKETDYLSPGVILPFSDGTCFEGIGKRPFYEMLCGTSAINALWIRAYKRCLSNSLPDYKDMAFVKYGEDLMCSLSLVTNARRIVYLDQNLYYYRQRQGSVVHTFDPCRYKSIKMVHQEMERWIDIWNMPELHPMHYAREIRGAVDTVYLAAQNYGLQDLKRFFKEIKSISQDSFFRDAYKKMDQGCLSGFQLMIAKCLYEKKYLRIALICFAAVFSKKVRDFVRLHARSMVCRISAKREQE